MSYKCRRCPFKIQKNINWILVFPSVHFRFARLPTDICSTLPDMAERTHFLSQLRNISISPQVALALAISFHHSTLISHPQKKKKPTTFYPKRPAKFSLHTFESISQFDSYQLIWTLDCTIIQWKNILENYSFECFTRTERRRIVCGTSPKLNNGRRQAHRNNLYVSLHFPEMKLEKESVCLSARLDLVKCYSLCIMTITRCLLRTNKSIYF